MTADLIASDLSDLITAAASLVNHVIELGLGTSILQWIASLGAIFLMFHYRVIMDPDQLSRRAGILTGLLAPYIFLTLPSVLFDFFRGAVGQWYGLIAVMLRILFPKYIKGMGGMPAVLLIVVAPGVIPSTFRGGSLDWVGLPACLAIACYLLEEHIRASGGFRGAFGEPRSRFISVFLVLIFIFPAWAWITYTPASRG